MKVCYTGGAVKDCGSYYSVATNAVELRIWFLTDDILRIRAGFDGDWDEASYSLTMTAWESRTDELMKDCRKRVQSAAASLTDGDRQAVIQGARLKVVIEKAPFRIMVYDKDGSLLHADIPDLAYREDSNHRRIHASQIEADDCFYGFGEKSGEINKAEKYMNMQFLPAAFSSLPVVDFGWPGVDVTLFGETFKWNILGYDAAHGGLPYFCAYMIAMVIGECINFPIQRNFVFRSKGNLGKQIAWYVLAFCVITCIVNSINCVWVAVAGLLVPDFIYNIGTTVLNGGVSMVIFFFVNKIIFPESGK